MAPVLFERRGRVAIVTLNRPEKRNAMSNDMRQALREAWRTFKAEHDLRVAVLTGAGDRAFCAGRDLHEYSQELDKVAWVEATGLDDIETDETLRKPIIAAVEGYCLGAGMSLAVSCDMRVASESAVFGYPEVTWGIPVVPGSLRLPRLVPMGIALELLLTGRRLEAAEAQRIGFVNRLVPNGSALAVALEMAETIAANAPQAVQATREIAWRGTTLPFRDAVRLGEGLRGAARESGDIREGMAAFREKRPPGFTGQ